MATTGVLVPRSRPWATPYCSEYNPGGPQAARFRSNQRAAATRCPWVVGVQALLVAGGGEQQQSLSEGMELELLIDMEAATSRPGVAGQPEHALVGQRVPACGVGRAQIQAEGEQPFYPECCGVLEQRVRARRRLRRARRWRIQT